MSRYNRLKIRLNVRIETVYLLNKLDKLKGYFLILSCNFCLK